MMENARWKCAPRHEEAEPNNDENTGTMDTLMISLLLATGLLCFALFFRSTNWFEKI